MNFEMNFIETQNYSQRIRKDNLRSLLFSVLVSLIVFIISKTDIEYVVLIGSAFFLIQYFKSARWERIFITEINVLNDEVNIKYKERNNEQTINGDIRDLKLKKAFGFSRSRVAYLSILFQKGIEIRQYEIGEWNDKKFDEILSLFSNKN